MISRATILLPIGLFLLILLSYGNSLLNGFAMDDDFIIVDNPMIRSLHSIPRLFVTDYWAREGAIDHLTPRSTGLYRPLVLVSYALNYQVGGLDAWSYHLINLLLHGFVTAFVFLIATRLGISLQGSAVAAGVFALHPIHTEAVTGIVGRAELLMSVAMLGALWLAILKRTRWSLAVFFVGLFAKEQTVMLPAVIMLYDLCVRKPRRIETPTRRRRTPKEPFLTKTDVVRYGSYGLVLGGYLIIRGLALQGLTLPKPAFLDNPLAYAETAERILTALKVAGYYLWLCVWPISLSADYSYDAIPVASRVDIGVAAGALASGALIWWMFRSYFKGDRQIAFVLGFMILSFLPVSNLLVPIGTIMGERLFYLPSAGLCFFAGIGYDALRRATDCSASLGTRHSALILAVLLCFALLVRTVYRNQDWANNHTLFQSAEKAVPSSAKIRSYMGRVYQAEQNWTEALRRYHAAVAIYPGLVDTDASVNVNLGDVYFKLGTLDKAVEVLQRAIRLAPFSPEAHYNLGLAYARLKRYEEAEPMLRKALSLREAFPEAHNTLSRLLAETGRYQEALTEANTALSFRPAFSEAIYNRGLALRGLGRTDEATAAFQEADAGRAGGPAMPGVIEKR